MAKGYEHYQKREPVLVYPEGDNITNASTPNSWNFLVMRALQNLPKVLIFEGHMKKNLPV